MLSLTRCNGTRTLLTHLSSSLPPYTSKEVCKRKLLFAVRHAPNMDSDFVARSAARWEDL